MSSNQDSSGQSSSNQTKKKEPKNWDKIVKDFEEEEEKTKESSVDELFKKIYEQSDESTRKAMNKSFSESGGTVLSTNWKEVKEKKVEVKPPDGVEFKQYN